MKTIVVDIQVENVKPAMDVKPVSDIIPIIYETPEEPKQPGKIREAVYYVRASDKLALLINLLKEEEIQRAIIFTKTRFDCERLNEFLIRVGIESKTFH